MRPISYNQTRINRESPCQCSSCQEWFTGCASFDMHRVGDHRLKRGCNLAVVTPDGYHLKLVKHSNGTAWQRMKK